MKLAICDRDCRWGGGKTETDGLCFTPLFPATIMVASSLMVHRFPVGHSLIGHPLQNLFQQFK